MLRVKSFAITDHEGINSLLDNNRLAKGAHILVSDGHVCIPYEDGQPLTNAQRIVALQEQKNVMQEELDIVEHSQGVVDLQIADANERLNVAQDKFVNNKVTAETKTLEAKRNEAKQALDQAENLKLQNSHEIVRMKRNTELFDEQIAKLSV